GQEDIFSPPIFAWTGQFRYHLRDWTDPRYAQLIHIHNVPTLRKTRRCVEIDMKIYNDKARCKHSVECVGP
ncbi:MAG TPA: hypothetical protein VFE62_30400, partial [Gemmataceae bacterium]|nr:hypothetical protein [Gemmataceae bacterium]